MSSPLPPPPSRTIAAPKFSATTTDAPKPGWKERGKGWGKYAMDKSVIVSDWVGVRANGVADKLGSEHFYPVSGDFPQEMDKAARIIRAFTVDGLETTIVDEKSKKQKKVLRKIPPKIIKDAVGLCVFTSFRSGIAPFGGAGGAGIVVARLPDGSWSAPSSLSPNNLSAGFMLGIDIYDAILVIRTQKALESFSTHKATLGTDIAVVAGPYGAGAAAEVGLERAPVLSYVRSRGLYAGVQLVGQVFVDRYDENAAMYQWPGVKAGDILSGKVRVPREAQLLHEALRDAESGRAQTLKGATLDVVVYPEIPDDFDTLDGEILHLPPTPTMVDNQERNLGKERSMQIEKEELEELERRLSRVDVERQEREGDLGGEEKVRRKSVSVYTPASHSSSRSSSNVATPHRGPGPALPVRRNLPPPLPGRSSSPMRSANSSPRGSIDLPSRRAVPPPPPPQPAAARHEDLLSVPVPASASASLVLQLSPTAPISVEEADAFGDVGTTEGESETATLPEYDEVVLSAETPSAEKERAGEGKGL